MDNQDLITKILCVIKGVWKHIVTIICVFIVCGIIFDTYKTMNYVPTYSSSLTATLGNKNNTFSDISSVQNYISTFNFVLNSETAKDDIKDKMNRETLNVTFNASNSTANIVTITATSTSKQEAYFSLGYVLDWYDENTKNYNFPYKVTILEKTSFSTLATNTNDHKRNFVKGGIVGAGLITVFYVLFIIFKETLLSSDDVKRHIKTRLYAKIPFVHKRRGLRFWKKNKEALVLTSYKTPFEYKEAIHKLSHKLQDSASHHDYKTIMVTSSLENEGKSSVAANIALSLASSHKKVLLIDADIKKPSMDKIFNINSDKTLNDYLKGYSDWADNVLFLEKGNLFVLQTKQDLSKSEELLGNDRFEELIKSAREVFDYVIIDSSPATETVEPAMINKYMDATLFVAKQDVAPRRLINETISKLNMAKNNVIGVVYNASVRNYFTQSNRKSYGYRNGRYGRGRS